MAKQNHVVHKHHESGFIFLDSCLYPPYADSISFWIAAFLSWTLLQDQNFGFWS